MGSRHDAAARHAAGRGVRPGRALGLALHGVPISPQEAFKVAGPPTTCGCACQDEVTVQRLTPAGAVWRGKRHPPPSPAEWPGSPGSAEWPGSRW